jgi:beta-xylosidase
MRNHPHPSSSSTTPRTLVLATLALLFALRPAAAQQTGLWGDQLDGTYRNPILAMDYSDPDVIRVGRLFYMIPSTFEGSPGMPVLESEDLVNWRTVGSVIPDMAAIGPDLNWDRMSTYGKGLYAPSIRFHAGMFWVFVTAPRGEGFWVATAKDARGPWTLRQMLGSDGKPLRVGGWTDPCPFWDSDGTAYLAASKPGTGWLGYLFRMSPDGTQLLDGQAQMMSAKGDPTTYPGAGTIYSPFRSTEGNRIYQRNGFYYLLHIEFLPAGRGQGSYVLRSRHLFGTKKDGTPGMPGDPGEYDVRRFSDVQNGAQDIPGQGGLVDTPDGRWFWIGQYNRYGADGRTPNLLPVAWVDDWPIIGAAKGSKDRGIMQWQLPKPLPGKPALPIHSDAFDTSVLDPQWEWNHQPRAGMWSLSERPGYLRLHAFPPVRPGFWGAGDTLGLRHMRSVKTEVTAKIDVTGFADGQEGGLAHYNSGRRFATLSVVQSEGKRVLKFESEEAPNKNHTADTVDPGVQLTSIWMRTDAGFDDLVHFSYSLDGIHFTPIGQPQKLTPGNYRGDQAGLYTVNPTKIAGVMDIDFFNIETVHTKTTAAILPLR